MIEPGPEHVRAADELLRLVGEGSDGVIEWATAARDVHEALRVQLTPIIGDAGFEALFKRSISLTRREYPQLRPALQASLQSLAPQKAAVVATTLFATFFGLLGTFIGDALTWRVLKIAFPAWNDPGTKETDA